MKTCPNCGASVEDDAVFCTVCGKPLGDAAAPAVSAIEETSASAAQAAETMVSDVADAVVGESADAVTEAAGPVVEKAEETTEVINAGVKAVEDGIVDTVSDAGEASSSIAAGAGEAVSDTVSAGAAAAGAAIGQTFQGIDNGSSQAQYGPQPGTGYGSQQYGPQPGTGYGSQQYGPQPGTGYNSQQYGPQPGTSYSSQQYGPQPGTGYGNQQNNQQYYHAASKYPSYKPEFQMDKFLALFAYFGSFMSVLIAYFGGDWEGRRSDYLKFHLNQALVFSIAHFLDFIPFLGWMWGVFVFVCWIIAVVKACQGKTEPVLFFGTLRIIK